MHYTETVARAGRRARHRAGAWPHGLILAGLLLFPFIAVPWAVAWPGAHTLLAISTWSVWAAGPVYTVADVERSLAQAPSEWVGRTVLVQGRVALDRTWSPPDSIVTRLALVDPGRLDGVRPLYLQWGNADPLLATLRRFPLVGRFAPQPQRPSVGLPGIYRVRLDELSSGAFGSADAVLLDPDPDAG